MPADIKALRLRKGSNIPALLFNIMAVLGLVAMLATGWPSGHPAFIAALILALVYFEHCWTIIFHEDAHLMLYRARWHNYFNGVLVGTLLLTPFTIYRQSHIRHHSKMNSPEDWELWPYVDPQTTPRFRRLFVVFDILLGLVVGPWTYARIFFHKDSPLTEPRIRRQIRLEYAIMIVFWAALLTLVAWGGFWRAFLLAYLLPAWITGMVQTMRKLVEHLGLPGDDAMGGARTIIGTGPIARFIDWTSLHISQHGLHHLFPQVPHENLEAAFQTLPPEKQKTFPSYWSALLDTLPHLARPGIGVNATTAAPAATAA